MSLRILALAALLCGLVYWEDSLASERSLDRSESSRLKPLMEDEIREGLVVAGVRIETASGENFLYARSKGIWRLLEPALNAYAAAGAIERLMQSLVESTGVVVTDEKHRAKSYGFGGDQALRVTFHGTQLRKAEDGDVLYAIDLGSPIQGTEGAYVRPVGSHAVWSIDHNPRTNLARPFGSSFPPMLDTNLIPGVQAAQLGGLVSIEVIRTDGEHFGLRAVPRDPSEVEPDEPNVSWEVLRASGVREPSDTVPARGFSIYLFRAPYSKVLLATEVEPEMLKHPDARLVLTPARGEPFQLLFGAANPDGSRKVANLGTGTLFEVDGEVANLLLPTLAQATRESEGNPWHDYIQFNPITDLNPLLTPLSGR
ncbi:MAG: hypothetical protein ACI8TQ_002586 [Planctomycetota bacterium]|jgi:hypothetical protein